MKSDVIQIDKQGNGFTDALIETRKIAELQGLRAQDAVRLQLMTEEMLSLVRSVTGEIQASFFIEGEGSLFTLHVTTKTVLDKEMRYHLISSASSRKNEAARSFLGYLRNALEEAMAAEADHSESEVPMELMSDVAGVPVADSEWDGYERSVLRKLADNIKISIRGGVVDMTVSKCFD